jgi:hypothetical protein
MLPVPYNHLVGLAFDLVPDAVYTISGKYSGSTATVGVRKLTSHKFQVLTCPKA